MHLLERASISVTSVFLLQILACYAITPHFNLTYANGDQRTIYQSEPELSQDEVTLNCNRGIWVTYSGFNYTFGDEPFETSSAAVNMEGACAPPVDFFDRVWSARSVGVASDNRIPSATFFAEWLLTGSVEIVSELGVPSIDFPLMSMITINTNVQFFTEPNYGGESFCFESMYPDNCFQGVCVVWTWLWEHELPWDIALARSLRIGCTPEVKRSGSPRLATLSPYPRHVNTERLLELQKLKTKSKLVF